MACRENDKLLTPAEEEGRCADEQRACPLPDEVGEDSVEIGFSIGAQRKDLHAQAGRRLLHILQLVFGGRIVCVDEHCDRRRRGNQFMQQAQPLSLQPLREKIDSSEITAGVAEAVDETERHWITAHPEHDRCCCGGSFCGACPVVAYRNKYGHPVPQQIGRKRRITIKVVLRRAELNRHILTLDIPGVLETGMKGCDLLAACLYTGNHESDRRHRRLLRTRRKRPTCSGTTDERDELAPPCMSRKQHSEG